MFLSQLQVALRPGVQPDGMTWPSVSTGCWRTIPVGKSRCSGTLPNWSMIKASVGAIGMKVRTDRPFLWTMFPAPTCTLMESTTAWPSSQGQFGEWRGLCKYSRNLEVLHTPQLAMADLLDSLR